MSGQPYPPARGHTAQFPAYGSAQPAPAGGPSNGSRYVLYALGLVVIAFLAGFFWWLIRSPGGDATVPPPSTSESPLTSGEYRYTAVAEPVTSEDCAANSYGKVAQRFAETPCRSLVRGMYTTEANGVRALVSVVRVTMRNAADAARLKVVTDTDGTGNVNDLQREGTVQLEGAPDVAGGGYDSAASGPHLTITEVAFFDDHEDEALANRIAGDALRIADEF